MKLINKTLLEQMRIHDAEVHHRKELLNFSKKDENLLLKCRNLIEANIDNIAHDFYDIITSFDEITLTIGDADTFERLIFAQKQYIIRLFSGGYDLDYVNSRLHVGLVHKRIGVDPKYYLSAVKTLKDILINRIEKEIDDKETREETINALEKLMWFDIGLIFDTYIRCLVSAIQSAKDKSETYALNLERKVQDRTQELHELSRKDGLTGLYNHRAFLELLERDISYAERNSSPLALVYFDVDNFKSINDTSGHLKGDEILKSVGSVLKELTREVDVPCRYGGDEFCVILPGNTSKDAEKFCQRLIQSFSAKYDDVTFSIGIAQTGPKDFVDSDTLIKHADSSMYNAKKNIGFHIATSPTPQSQTP
ncbi:sensor histidine kinase [Desulfoluna limicola]|uniref:Diguanylate cyclase DosC n=2 Tax=Desulfoluna limicola TaxID=2810562 RepID=A0ABN6F351_9BACT|nr:sensor histidine kinase [Desulfoluna limicola]